MYDKKSNRLRTQRAVTPTPLHVQIVYGSPHTSPDPLALSKRNRSPKDNNEKYSIILLSYKWTYRTMQYSERRCMRCLCSTPVGEDYASCGLWLYPHTDGEQSILLLLAFLLYAIYVGYPATATPLLPLYHVGK